MKERSSLQREWVDTDGRRRPIHYINNNNKTAYVVAQEKHTHTHTFPDILQTSILTIQQYHNLWRKLMKMLNQECMFRWLDEANNIRPRSFIRRKRKGTQWESRPSGLAKHTTKFVKHQLKQRSEVIKINLIEAFNDWKWKQNHIKSLRDFSVKISENCRRRHRTQSNHRNSENWVTRLTAVTSVK